MNTSLKLAATALAFAGAFAGLVAGPAASARPKLTGEARLAQILDGRVPGKPVSCISLNQANDVEIVDKTALVYKVGGTYYVNRPENASDLDDDSILVTRLSTSQLCDVDVVHLRDRYSPGFWRGFVSLNKFVPYKRPS